MTPPQIGQSRMIQWRGRRGWRSIDQKLHMSTATYRIKYGVEFCARFWSPAT